MQMGNKLQFELTQKIAEGIKRAIERMIDYKIRNDQAIIVYTEEKGIQKISGAELEKRRHVKIIVGDSEL